MLFANASATLLVHAAELAAPLTRPALNSLRQVNEADRMDAVRSYRLLDAPRDRYLDELTQLAAFICGTSVALISVMDGPRQVLRAGFGVDVPEMPRSGSFCDYAMRAEGVFEISDARQDPDFRNNPLVTHSPFMRFYAGVPLLTPEGLPLGTFCVTDTVPHELSHEQGEALRILSRQVSMYFELNRVRQQMTEEREKIDDLLCLSGVATQSALAGGWRNEIFVKQEQRLVRVLTADIHHIEALGDYVNVYTTRERYTVYASMKEMEAKLPQRDFARVHRKYIVRLDRIMIIETDRLVLDSPQESNRLSPTVPIGNSYKAALLSRLQQV